MLLSNLFDFQEKQIKFRGKDNPRKFNHDFLNDIGDTSQGEIFILPNGKEWDSTKKIGVVHHGVDTIRQFYKCLINQNIFYAIERTYNIGKSGATIELYGDNWTVNYGGKKTGYRYFIQNESKTIVVHLGSYHKKMSLDSHGNHLKIELSPIIILENSFEQVQLILDNYARLFCTEFNHSGVAIHICADVQGWSPKRNFEYMLRTRAQKVYKHSGIAEFDLYGEVVTYAKGNSFRFGSAGGIQFACYNKLKAVRDKGEREHFWLDVWKNAETDWGDKILKENKTAGHIWRLEFRFHQCVIKQFSRYLKITNKNQEEPLNFQDLVPHLTSLWQYGMNNFRLDADRNYIDHCWQYMRDDIRFYNLPPSHDKLKRIYPSQNLFEITDKQIERSFKSLMDIYRKLKYTRQQALV